MEVKMVRMTMSLALAVALLEISGGPARSGEKKIEKSEVPGPVLDAVARKYPAARMVGFERSDDDGKTLFEVAIESGATKMDVEVTPQGKIEVEETVIGSADLPAPVKAGLAASRYKNWKTQKIEKVIKQEKTDNPFYELVIQNKSKKLELVFDHDGKIAEQGKKSPTDNNTYN
jgi:hypothetical protein